MPYQVVRGEVSAGVKEVARALRDRSDGKSRCPKRTRLCRDPL